MVRACSPTFGARARIVALVHAFTSEFVLHPDAAPHVFQKGKGRPCFYDRPLFMPATTYFPTHSRVQYNRPWEAPAMGELPAAMESAWIGVIGGLAGVLTGSALTELLRRANRI